MEFDFDMLISKVSLHLFIFNAYLTMFSELFM